MNLRIRPAREHDDEDEIRELQKIVFPGGEKPDPDDPTSLWWVAERPDGMIVAFAGLSQIDDDTAYLCHCGVLPDYRGHGLQRRLIRVRVRSARARDYDAVVTDTYGSIVSANNLIACGFRLYRPEKPWKAEGALYWRREI